MQMTLIILPIITYIFLIALFLKKETPKALLEAILKGHLVFFALIAISTEVLSAFNAITGENILLAWLFFLLCSTGVVTFLLWQKKQIFIFPILRQFPRPPFYLGVIGAILFLTFFTALVYPTNTWDSMAYHMPRVTHWIANQNVSFYPTHIIRQNYQMPLAEFAILHIYLLTGGDFFVDLVQWGSFVIVIVSGVLIAIELGLSKQQQLLSALIIATLPMAILQASSSQNDLVVSTFIMAFALFMLRLRNNLSTKNFVWITISLGLALLAKGTAFIYCAGIGTVLGIAVLVASCRDRARFRRAMVGFLVAILLALLLNVGHFWRNYSLYGHPLSTEAKFYTNQDKSVVTLWSNILRNGAMHLGTPFKKFNMYEYEVMKVILGDELHNPKTTWRGNFFNIRYSLNENTAGNLIHMLLVLLAMALLPIQWEKGKHRQTIWYVLALVLGVILYCWLLTWQKWATRLHTPLFVLAAPILAITITTVGRKISYVILACLVLHAIPFCISKETCSLTSLEWKNQTRLELYFTTLVRKEFAFENYYATTKFVAEKDVDTVGLYMGENDWEYPLWVMAKQIRKDGKGIVFKHVGVENISRKVNHNKLTSLPRYVIATKSIEPWRRSSNYSALYTSEYLCVYEKLNK